MFLNMVRSADALGRAEAMLLRSRGLSGAQYNVLRILRGARPDGLRCAEIATRMVSRDPDVTRLLDRLERDGLVARERSAQDRRVVTTRITVAGLERVEGLDEPLDELLRRQLAHMSRADLRRLDELLEQVRPGAS